MSPRKREPGFYVAVKAPAGMSARPVELLDGPWPSRPAAERRAKDIASARSDEAASASIVRVAGDGFTILREEQQPG